MCPALNENGLWNHAHCDFDPPALYSFVVGADANSPVTGQKADLLAAAYNAVEAGLRGAKVGSKNWEITDNITKALAEYSGAGIKGVEGSCWPFASMLSAPTASQTDAPALS